MGAVDEHASFQCQTGRLSRNQAPGGWPSIGSVVSKLQGPAHPAVPPFIGLAPRMGHMEWADSGTPGFLGVPYSPFKPSVGEGKADMVLNGVTLDRLNNRKALLAGFDRFRRDADASGMMEGLDRFNQQAFNVLTSQRLMEALDIEREDPEDSRAVRPRRSEESRRRRPEVDGAFPDGPPAGRGGCPLRDLRLQPLGLARAEFRRRPARHPDARSGAFRP